ncbi:type II toxin-antitoxin system HicB family antitoxin [Candidatus Microgenomates bacterium]|nr:MAG: type II toxin-antitoxin system HicB family antitoxin [Candidatus Microgenomates bacterium]
METKALNYRIIIESDTETGTEKAGFTAFCPTFGIADDGDTVEEALTNLKKLIRFHIASLRDEGKEIPSKNFKTIVD